MVCRKRSKRSRRDGSSDRHESVLVQIGGFDTHSGQGTSTGGYSNLMNTLNTALTAFSNDLKNQGLWNNTLVVQFSEFGRRITENGSQGFDHGAAAIMLALGGSVHGRTVRHGTVARSVGEQSDPREQRGRRAL